MSGNYYANSLTLFTNQNNTNSTDFASPDADDTTNTKLFVGLGITASLILVTFIVRYVLQRKKENKNSLLNEGGYNTGYHSSIYVIHRNHDQSSPPISATSSYNGSFERNDSDVSVELGASAPKNNSYGALH